MTLSMQEFETAVARTAAGDEDKSNDITFDMVVRDSETNEEIERRTVTAHEPGEGQFALMMSAMGRHTRGEENLAGAVDFFLSLFDDDDKTYFRDRLWDRKDSFGAFDAMELMEKMVEVWGGRPTRQSSASASSRPTAGRTSNRRTRASSSSS